MICGIYHKIQTNMDVLKQKGFDLMATKKASVLEKELADLDLMSILSGGGT